MLKKISLFVPMLALGAMAFAGSAFGQGCGTDFGCGGGATNCGREISNADAEGLWAEYCHETCFDYGRNRRCGLRGGCASGDCFGYSSGGCGACDSGLAGLRGRKMGGRGGDCGGAGDCGCAGGRGRLFGGGLSGGGANCHGYPGGGFGSCSDGCGGGFGGGREGRFGASRGGCGLFSRGGCGGRSEGTLFRFLTGGNGQGLFSRSAANCGSCGEYFNEAVGYEYGTSGIVSNVAGCGTDFAGPGCNGGGNVDVNHGYSAQPAESGLMSAPQEPVSNVVPSATEPATEKSN